MQSHSKARQQIEETEEYEAGASGGLASSTLHYLDNLGSSSSGAMQERLNIVSVQFLERIKLSRTTTGALSIAF